MEKITTLYEGICIVSLRVEAGNIYITGLFLCSSSFFYISFWLNCYERDILNGVWVGFEPVYLLCSISVEVVQSVSILSLYPESCTDLIFVIQPCQWVLILLLNVSLLRDYANPLYVSTKVSSFCSSDEETNVQRGLINWLRSLSYWAVGLRLVTKFPLSHKPIT